MYIQLALELGVSLVSHHPVYTSYETIAHCMCTNEHWVKSVICCHFLANLAYKGCIDIYDTNVHVLCIKYTVYVVQSHPFEVLARQLLQVCI